ncbi:MULTISPECIES: DUF819 family protein [Kocuria]|uniref:DUF819 family protein n=1 Tax=Kocuria TaxID=57493 RepID=UPI000A1CB667|nr:MULTISPECIES: DUF819 family protein [Kocuria]MCT1367879.1 DUF819 family protein [Rothia sp. p3-SID1597]RUQ21129.1 DUF819 domain-containing protein [Kocuria sp. HSID16901]
MVTDGFLFLGVLMGLAAVIVFLEKRTRLTLFRYVPGFVLMYILTALLNTIGVFDHNEQVLATGTSVQDALLPAMILLLLFQCDVRKIIKLGPKLLLTFVVTAFSIFLGFVVAFLILQKVLDPEAWKALGALSASWTGGSANMVAVQSILQAPQNVFGYVLIVDTIIYSVWLLVMFGSVSISDKFNAWTKADTSYLDAHSGEKEADQQKPIDLGSLMCVIGFGIFISAVATAIGNVLPEVGVVITSSTWTILIVSVLGLVIGSTRLGAVAGSSEVATVMLYLIIGIIASQSDFSSLAQAPLYLVAGVIVMIVHIVVMVVYAKLTRTELFSLAVASTANIGGIASAPVVASAFNRQLVPVGVLFALMGAFLGTFFGLITAQVLAVL